MFIPNTEVKKVFEQLISAFEKEAFDKNILNLYLSVKRSNVRAVNAYKKAGWKISLEHEESFEMSKSLTPKLKLVDENFLNSSSLLHKEQNVQVSDTTEA